MYTDIDIKLKEKHHRQTNQKDHTSYKSLQSQEQNRVRHKCYEPHTQ